MTSQALRRLTAPFVIALAVSLVAPAVAGALQRSTVFSRGRVWVRQAVPYSQARYATVEGALIPVGTANPHYLGYRTDCSGFVSMALNLRTRSGRPYSLSTATLAPRLSRIRKEDLRRGDIILRPNDLVIDGRRVPYGHAVLFVAWNDSAKSSYVGYHQSSSGKGAVRSVIRYGASGFGSAAGFAPYRYVGVRDRVKLETRRTP